MTVYSKQQSVGGAWAKASELKTGMRAKIVSETNPSPSQFKNEDGTIKTQDVCKIKFEGLNDILNLSLNRTTINGLIDAFGEDSKTWMGQILTVQTIKALVSGKMRDILYLVPQGYEFGTDAEGFPTIKKEVDIPVINEDEGVDKDNLPF